MERAKKKRTNFRRQLTNVVKEMERLLDQDPIDKDELGVNLEMGEAIQLELEEVNREIVDFMFEDSAEDAEMDAEAEGATKYRKTFLLVKKKTEKALQGPAADDFQSLRGSSRGEDSARKGYSLPKIKLKEFSGDFKEWLGFWSQFRRIHEDITLDESVKFHYLEQAMKKGSPAEEFMNRYPTSDTNYPKAVEALIKRFGREELQVEVYVRELIKLLIHNVNQRDKITLSRLFDQLESHLRALESLGISALKNEAILFPLVESCLPVPVLRAWERSPLSKVDESGEANPKGRLHFLMEFLRAEVESEQRISLACEGFGTKETKQEPNIKDKKVAWKVKKSEEGRTPTAAGLINETTGPSCAFCSGEHDMDHCQEGRKMSLQERKDKLKKTGRCFICMEKGCWAKSCNSNIACYLCGKKHHTLLCPASSKKDGDRKPKNESKEKNEEEVQTTASTANLAGSGEVFLQTAMVEVINGSKRKKVRVLFDTGSQRTHIMSSTAKELDLEGKGTETLIHVLFGGVQSEVTHQKYQVALKTKDSSFHINVDVLDQDRICHRLPSVPRGKWMSELKEKGIWLEDMENGDEEIQMLIGGDVYGKLLTGRSEQLKCGLTAVETKLGWTVMGIGRFPSGKQRPATNSSMLVTSLTVSQLSVPDLWRLESIGILDPIDQKTKEEEQAEVLRKFEDTVERTSEGRYIVKLPWRGEVNGLPTNRGIAEKRLVSATKKLFTVESWNSNLDYEPKDDKISLLGTFPESASLLTQGADWKRAGAKTNNFMAYHRVFQEWLEEDIIEEIPDDKVENCHYLPHRAVIKQESVTTKVRPVFDASCKSGRAPSLNECLEKGPNLIDLIPSVMMRFRKDNIGVCSDIRKAFLMIEMAKEDKDFLRFLWWEGPECSQVKVYRHKRVVFGVNSSPFLLGAVIQHHLAQYKDEKADVAQKLLQSLYVDNCVTSVSSNMELERFRRISVEMMDDAKMDLRLWQDSFDVQEEMEDRVVAVLGMKWDRFTDVLYCDLPSSIGNWTGVTKRAILSMTQQVFDPLGILSPVTVQPKLLLQEAWAQKKGWDDAVDEEAQRKFLTWTSELPLISQIQIPRCFRGNNEDRRGWSLHCFCDASSYAYAAVVFLRSEGTEVTTQLLQAKARVAPLKKSTIPRLELVSCLIGARLTAAVKAALDFVGIPTFYWSDSSTALSWIKRNDDWGTFVGNRVREILSLSEAQQWSHVPGRINPADLPSRGCGPAELLASQWWEGPEWLKRDHADWPTESVMIDEEKVSKETKKTVVYIHSLSKKMEPQRYICTSEDCWWNHVPSREHPSRDCDPAELRASQWWEGPGRLDWKPGESTVNARPLTVMTEDGPDLVALTPEMFIQGVRESGLPEVDVINMEGMICRLQFRQELMEQSRSRFRKEYLGNLLDRAKMKPNYNLRVGDIVLIGEDGKKRQGWQLGKVEGLIGERIARIRTPGGIITRPVRRLYPMELNPADDEHKKEAEVFTRVGRKIRKPQRFQ